jgi:uncharacterized Rmd1/YagE family protein
VEEEMQFMLNRRGTAALEWIAVAVIVVAVVGTILWNIFQQLAVRYVDIYNGL